LVFCCGGKCCTVVHLFWTFVLVSRT